MLRVVSRINFSKISYVIYNLVNLVQYDSRGATRGRVFYYTRLAQQVSPAGSVTSGSDSHLDCHSIPSVSLRYPERAKELFEKAEATAKAKYERLVKFVDFYS